MVGPVPDRPSPLVSISEASAAARIIPERSVISLPTTYPRPSTAMDDHDDERQRCVHDCSNSSRRTVSPSAMPSTMMSDPRAPAVVGVQSER